MLKVLARFIFYKLFRKGSRHGKHTIWIGKDDRPGWIEIELDGVDFNIHVDGEDLIKNVKEVLEED